ncbi:MAG: prepilin-type N-terminal cleavage/methylation domain-containing protein [Candidatus Saccharimonadales bacterium]
MIASKYTPLHSINRGFTIVELLIVITVLGILITIVAVSYNGVQRSAKKSAIESTAQQVKLKLGEHYTDKNMYPITKADVVTYLNAVDATAIASDFNKSYNSTQITYRACDSSASSCAATNCDNVATPCRSYAITIPATAWGGSASDSSTVIRP